ncbi:MAG: hypothetical protein IPL23_29735 [Saprospiraceae bacterium]|nr:hypothetical protein [Saprospiraceae bacterium]MBP7643761.1 hypothetical protein [Saprospiraceae bacterium]
MAIGQDVKVSREIGIRNEFVYEIMPDLKGNTLVYRDRGNQFYFDIFSSNLDFQRTAEINFEQRRVNVLQVAPFDTTIHIYFNYYQQDTFYFSRLIYSAEASFIRQDTLVKIDRSAVKEKFRFALSQDQTKIALFSIGENLTTAVFDVGAGVLLYQNILKLTGIGERENFRNFTVTDDGNVFVLFEVDNDSGEKNHHFNLLKSIDNQTYSLHRIPMPNKYSSGVKFAYDNKNRRLGIAGLYSNKYESETNGYYMLNTKVSELQTDEGFVFVEYDDDLVREMYGKKKGKNNEIRDQVIKKLIWRADGGLILLTEMEKEYIRRSALSTMPTLGSPSLGSQNYGNRGLVDYYHEDMMIFSVFPDGTEHWRKILFKKQFSQDDDGAFSSFFLFSTPSRLHIVYNDEIKNSNTISEYVIDPLGRFERNAVLNTDYQGLKLRFQDAVQTGSNSFVVPSEKNYKLSLVKVTF